MSADVENAQDSQTTDDELLLRRRRHRPSELIAGLNLTAMMDVMTILLVYLIKVYASAPENITLNDDLRPPMSTAPDTIQPSVSVLISRSAVLVDNVKVLDIEGGQVKGGDDKNPYQPVAEALNRRVETIKAIAQRGGSAFDGNLMLIADQGTPYEIVSSVLYQAGKSQFTSYRLVVVHK